MRLYLLLFLFITILFLGKTKAKETVIIWHKINIKNGSYYYNKTGRLFATQLKSELSRLALENKVALTDLNYQFSTYKTAKYILRGEYVSLTEDESKVTALVSLLNLQTGKITQFQATDESDKVVTILAKNFFNYFQLNKLSKWNSDKPLTWLEPNNPNMRKWSNSFQEAKILCNQIGARLPYAKELLVANSVGGYSKGGIELDYSAENFYPVKDQANLDESDYNYYYYTGNEDHIISNGRFLSDAGAGPIQPKLICVRGKISNEIKYNEQLFQLHRTTTSKNAKKILRFLISKSDSIAYKSVKYRTIAKFSSIEEAKNYLKKHFHIIIE